MHQEVRLRKLKNPEHTDVQGLPELLDGELDASVPEFLGIGEFGLVLVHQLAQEVVAYHL